MNNVDTSFQNALDGIEESVKGVNFDCPTCGGTSRTYMQALCVGEQGAFDRYSQKCLVCGDKFNVDSKPLPHLKDLCLTK